MIQCEKMYQEEDYECMGGGEGENYDQQRNEEERVVGNIALEGKSSGLMDRRDNRDEF